MSHTQYSIPSHITDNNKNHLLYLSISTCEQDWTSVLHYHPFSEIIYVLEGSGFFCSEHEKVPLVKDSLIIINPNIKHTESSCSNTPLTYMVLGISNISFIFDNQVLETYKIFNSQENKNLLYPLFQNILYELQKKHTSYIQICQHYIDILLLKISSLIGSSASICTHEAIKIPPECVQIKNYIDKYYIKPITLGFLSEYTHLNKYYLSHIFKSVYGKSPINYLQERRILRCKELLKDFDFSVSEIAEMTGFSSSNYLSQIFKKHTGISPLEYRKKNSSKGTST